VCYWRDKNKGNCCNQKQSAMRSRQSIEMVVGATTKTKHAPSVSSSRGRPICSTISRAFVMMLAPVRHTIPAISSEYHRAPFRITYLRCRGSDMRRRGAQRERASTSTRVCTSFDPSHTMPIPITLIFPLCLNAHTHTHTHTHAHTFPPSLQQHSNYQLTRGRGSRGKLTRKTSSKCTCVRAAGSRTGRRGCPRA
jgi:hypothetical protein